jgi:scyllo-inositol 2-dehydrogenase (NADP+)
MGEIESRISKALPTAKRYDSFESILEDNSIDLVVVNTPTYTHYPYAKRALEANKHVIVEKAFTTTLAEAVELAELAKNKRKLLSVYQNRRWDSDYLTVKSIVQSNKLGKLVDVSFSYDRYNPELSPKKHKEKQAPGGGLLLDLGPHLIDQAIHLFGMPQEVFGTLAIRRKRSVVNDFIDILLYYNEFMVRLKASYFVKEPLPAFVLNGTKGSFIKSRGDVQETELQKGSKPNTHRWGEESEAAQGLLHTEIDGIQTREKIKTIPGNYMEYYDGIYHALVNNAEVPVSANEGIQVMKIIEAVFESNGKKSVVSMT